MTLAGVWSSVQQALETVPMAVRPTTLTDGQLTNNVKLVDNYDVRTRISRADVAAWMLDALYQTEPFENRTPTLATSGIRTRKTEEYPQTAF